MVKLKDIVHPVNDDLIRFNIVLKESVKSNINLINIVINYILKNKGKQLRPILCLLSAKICSKPNDSSLIAASLIEMLHIATLVHDDIIDDSPMRRGWPSIKTIWKNKISLLIGDYIFSKALSNMIKLRNLDALEILSDTSDRLSQGELLQMERAKNKEMDEAVYFKMVSDKTASLFSASAEIGALTVDATNQQRKSLKKFGEKLGIAFQIKDDLFDVTGTQHGLGKPVGFDVKRNLLTFPFIHYISNIDSGRRRYYQSKLKFHAKRKELNKIKDMITKSGSLEYTHKVMGRISNEAIEELNIFKESDSKNSLISLVKYNLNRTR